MFVLSFLWQVWHVIGMELLQIQYPMNFVDSSYICASLLRWIHDMYVIIRDAGEVITNGFEVED